MPSTRQNKIVTITNDENYDLAGHMARLADSANVIIPVVNQAARDALVSIVGMVVYRIDNSQLEVNTAPATWKVISPSAGGYPPFMMHAGAQTVSVGVGNASGTATVTFPAPAFTDTPIITLGFNANTGNNSYKLQPHFYGISTTGFTVQLITIDGGTVNASYALPVHWHAIQMTPSSAAG